MLMVTAWGRILSVLLKTELNHQPLNVTTHPAILLILAFIPAR